MVGSSSGMASSAVLLTVVALGAAAGVAVRSEPEYVAPARVVHRGLPGPAQIELAEAGLAPARAEVAPEPVALFGVDTATAISFACGDTGSEMFTLESVICELAAQALKHIPKADSEYISLFLPSG